MLHPYFVRPLFESRDVYRYVWEREKEHISKTLEEGKQVKDKKLSETHKISYHRMVSCDKGHVKHTKNTY